MIEIKYSPRLYNIQSINKKRELDPPPPPPPPPPPFLKAEVMVSTDQPLYVRCANHCFGKFTIPNCWPYPINFQRFSYNDIPHIWPGTGWGGGGGGGGVWSVQQLHFLQNTEPQKRYFNISDTILLGCLRMQ